MNIGFTIGKFAPLHKGHEELIERGLKENDKFYILINDTDVTQIPLEERAKWLKKLFPQAHVIIGNNPPQKFGMDEESIKIQTDYLKNIFKNIPVTTFYSGEDYGKFVARDLHVKFVKIDKKIPICATEIRKEPDKNKAYMEKDVYQDLKKYNTI